MSEYIQLWENARDNYSWNVSLRTFAKANEYPGFFEQDILSKDTEDFENKFRDHLANDGNSNFYVIAGEVCFWKLKFPHKKSNSKTTELLEYLSNPSNWSRFRNALYILEKEPTYDNFCNFRNACNISKGFAVPVTYLSFLNPEKYPMADSNIANWWKEHIKTAGGNEFSQDGRGVIQSQTVKQTHQTWKAYLEWTDFCNEYAEKLSELSGSHWRARDVEMAVFSAQKSKTALPII